MRARTFIATVFRAAIIILSIHYANKPVTSTTTKVLHLACAHSFYVTDNHYLNMTEEDELKAKIRVLSGL